MGLISKHLLDSLQAFIDVEELYVAIVRFAVLIHAKNSMTDVHLRLPAQLASNIGLLVFSDK